jgi:hypothetical protein
MQFQINGVELKVHRHSKYRTKSPPGFEISLCAFIRAASIVA